MAQNFDPKLAQTYFTSKFYNDHVYLSQIGAKKNAEIVFQRRGEYISTVLCLTYPDLVQLAGEIHHGQAAYSQSPLQAYTTLNAYECWSRGGPQAKDRQRASPRRSPFLYKVCLVHSIYVVYHFHGFPGGLR
jgi:hypothetical protein